jgi:hypothetical protein
MQWRIQSFRPCDEAEMKVNEQKELRKGVSPDVYVFLKNCKSRRFTACLFNQQPRNTITMGFLLTPMVFLSASVRLVCMSIGEKSIPVWSFSFPVGFLLFLKGRSLCLIGNLFSLKEFSFPEKELTPLLRQLPPRNRVVNQGRWNVKEGPWGLGKTLLVLGSVPF